MRKTTLLKGVLQMSIVIIGGNERMERNYKDLCREYDCKAKVFAKYSEAMQKKIGNPDLMVLFTSTVSHKMIKTALTKIRQPETTVVRSHSSSMAALKSIMEEHAAPQKGISI